MEKVTNLNEKKIDGYFDTLKSVFFTKLEAELFLFNRKGQGRIVLDSNSLSELKKEFTDFERFDLFFHNGDGSIMLNFHDEIISSIVMNSWVIFELIIKDLTKKDYSEQANDISMDYKSNKFGFSKDEKAKLDFFYYIRNSYVHYNGAYHASKSIDYIYEGQHFLSENHEGEQIELNNIKIAYKIHLDLQELSKKAWKNTALVNNKT